MRDDSTQVRNEHLSSMQTRAKKRQQREQCHISQLDFWMLRECSRFLNAPDLMIARQTTWLWHDSIPKPKKSKVLLFLRSESEIPDKVSNYVQMDVVGFPWKLSNLPVFPNVEVLEFEPRRPLLTPLEVWPDELNAKFPKLKSLSFSDVVPQWFPNPRLGVCENLRRVRMPMPVDTNLESLFSESTVEHVTLSINCFAEDPRTLRLPQSVQRLSLLPDATVRQSSMHDLVIIAPGLKEFVSSYPIFHLCRFSHPERLESFQLYREHSNRQVAWLQDQIQANTSLETILAPFASLTSLSLSCLHFSADMQSPRVKIQRLALSICRFCAVANGNRAFANLCSAFPAVEHLSLEFTSGFAEFRSSMQSRLPTAWLKKLTMLRALTIVGVACLDLDLAERLRRDVPRLESLKLSQFRLDKPGRFLLTGLKRLEICTFERDAMKESVLRTFLQNSPKLEACIFSPQWFPLCGSKIRDEFPLVRFRN